MNWVINQLLWFTTHEHHLADYMYRYWIFFKRRKDKWQLRLHYILRSDHDRHLHNHPWWYVSIILSGGYWEVTEANNEWIKKYVTDLTNDRYVYDPENIFRDGNTWYKKKWYGPGSILFRKAAHVHRLRIQPERRAWTLFLCGKKTAEWGFITEKGFIPWKVYLVMTGQTEMIEDEEFNNG